MAGFAVIDFETTGLFPGGHDRVIELAVVHVNERGDIEGRWETLVNPGRDLGRQDIHRIRAADVLPAPTFDQIAGQLVDLLRGRVVVAHNASFDTRFLLAELRRAGHTVPAEPVSLCTMQLARDFLPGAGRSLADCCAALDIDLDGAHRASADALATARLLAAYIDAADAPEFWFAHLAAAAHQLWPVIEVAPVDWCPRTVSAHPLTAAPFLERITTRLPDVAGPAEYVDYLALLDRCLLDRALSAHEADALVRLAGELGLGRAACSRLHGQYFQALTALAWSDGILTTAERADLLSVGRLLAVPAETIAAALDETGQQTPAPLASTALGAGFALLVGDLVVLTGEMTRSRSAVERDLLARGLVPWRGVTKKVKLLVAADTDSLSGKARKARDYGIPIVGDATLARLVSGLFVDA